MIRVALIQCPVWGVEDPPLGLAQMAGCVTHCGLEPLPYDLNVALWRQASLKEKEYWGWNKLALWNDSAWVNSFFENAEGQIERHVEQMLKKDPHVIAFTAAVGSQWATLETARRIKKRSPLSTVVVGGPLFTDPAQVDIFIRHPAVDIVVSGVGEDIFPKMLGLFVASGHWIPLPGMYVKSKEGIVRGGRPVPYTFDLDISPLLDFSGLSWESYANPIQVPISASRGCPWSCHFCGSRGYWAKFSFKSGDRIFQDVNMVLGQNRRGKHLRFYDIMANGNAASLSRFSEMLLEYGVADRGITWNINAAIKPEMDSGLFALWHRSGCREVVYGIESGSQRVLRAMNKPFALSDAENVLRDTNAAGIRCIASFIPGFPGETEADFQDTLDFVEKNGSSIDGICVSPAMAEDPSLLYRRPELFGAIDEGLGRRRAERLKEWALEIGLEVIDSSYSVNLKTSQTLVGS